jgi:hypothetical protein
MMPIVRSLLIVYSLSTVMTAGMRLRATNEGDGVGILTAQMEELTLKPGVQKTNKSDSDCPLHVDKALCKSATELLRQHLIMWHQDTSYTDQVQDVTLSTDSQFIRIRLDKNKDRMDEFVRELKNGSVEALKKEIKKKYPVLDVDDVTIQTILETNQWVFNAAKVAKLDEIDEELEQEINSLDPNFCKSMHEKKKFNEHEYKEVDQNKNVDQLTEFATKVLKCFLHQRHDPQEIQQNGRLLKAVHGVLNDKSFDSNCNVNLVFNAQNNWLNKKYSADIEKCNKTDNNRVAVSKFLESTKKLADWLGKDVAVEESRRREAFVNKATLTDYQGTIKGTYDFGDCKVSTKNKVGGDCYVLAVANSNWVLEDHDNEIKYDGSHYAGHIHGLWYQKEKDQSKVPRPESIYHAGAKIVAPAYSWAGTFLSWSTTKTDEQAQLMSTKWLKHGKKSTFGPTDYWNHAELLLGMSRRNKVPSKWIKPGQTDDKYCFKRTAAGWKHIRCVK